MLYCKCGYVGDDTQSIKRHCGYHFMPPLNQNETEIFKAHTEILYSKGRTEFRVVKSEFVK